MKRILIADDHDTVRAGLRAILERHVGWEIVAEARNGAEAVAAAVETSARRCHCRLLDAVDDRCGSCAAHQKASATDRDFDLYRARFEWLAWQAFQAGARAFLLKSDASKMLLAAVESLILHKPFYAGAFSSELRSAASGKGDLNEVLSPREKTIVKLVAEGHSNKGVSAILNLSIKTTETHRAAAMRKLNINSTAGLVRYAVRSKLVEA